MILTDTGPLVALLNRNDPNHQRCLATLKNLPAGPLVTTWSCFTEAMYLLFRAAGYPGQWALWNLRNAGRLTLLDHTSEEIDRIAALMDRYRDTPMDLADASLVAVGESRGMRQVLTLDRHFYGFRLADGRALEVIPPG